MRRWITFSEDQARSVAEKAAGCSNAVRHCVLYDEWIGRLHDIALLKNLLDEPTTLAELSEQLPFPVFAVEVIAA